MNHFPPGPSSSASGSSEPVPQSAHSGASGTSGHHRSASSNTTATLDPRAPAHTASHDPEQDESTTRVQLACFYCRTKRIRCSGTKPVCTACEKARVECEWPAGRRRKRTRREMEEARREQAEAEAKKAATMPPTNGAFESEGIRTVPAIWSTGLAPMDDGWGNSNNFVWPSNFLPGAFDFNNPPLDPNSQMGTAATAPTSLPTGSTSADGFGSFLKEHSPATDMQLLNALNQTAYLSGDGTADDPLELYYYRFSGSTAINPGIHRISLKLQRRPGPGVPEPEEQQSHDGRSDGGRSVRLPPPNPADLFDPTGLPHRHVWDVMLDRFFVHMSSHFPSVSRNRMMERYESGTMSAFLANCICALGARFGESNPLTGQDGDHLEACAPFVAKAQELVVPLLHLPAHDVCTGLLFLAWASYGQNSDAGLWQFTGMSIRMAIDLGLHENSDIYESEAHVIRTRNLFWSLFITDTVLAFSTGRTTTIPEDIIEIPLPEDEDFFPDPSRDCPTHPTFAPNEVIQPVPFVYLVRLMIVTARIANVLNGRRGRARTLVAADKPLGERLVELQARLVAFYAALPDTMRWSADNFKLQHARGHGSTFLTLHLWAHAVLALVYHPDLLRSPSGVDTPLSASMPRNVRLASASSRQICECMVFADLVSHTSYTASPFVVQPLYVAAMALVHEMRNAQTASENGSAAPSDMFLVTITKQNLTALLRAIVRTEAYWAGANYVATILEKRSGLSISSSTALRRTFISLPDQGLLRRFQVDRDNPASAHVAPATDSSLRESIARHSSGPSPMMMADLLNGYSIEGMSFGPAGSMDFARLVAAGGWDGQPHSGHGLTPADSTSGHST